MSTSHLKPFQHDLLKQAEALPDATAENYVDGRTAPVDVPSHLLKVITDSKLRSKLIRARLAQGVQSPKGPQKIASILQIFPHGDAPELLRVARSSKGKNLSTRRSKLPSVIQMRTLLTRVEAVSGHVAREAGIALEQEILDLQRQIAEAAPESLEQLSGSLSSAISRRNDNSAQIIREARKQIQADDSFPERVYLRFLAD
jgi:hypothetical protein